MYKAEILKSKEQKDKKGGTWKVNPPTTWGVVNKDGYPVAFVPNHCGEAMSHLIAKLLNENRKYKLKNA
jgi:hypothetical protein